jgi:hypothetical protein
LILLIPELFFLFAPISHGVAKLFFFELSLRKPLGKIVIVCTVISGVLSFSWLCGWLTIWMEEHYAKWKERGYQGKTCPRCGYDVRATPKMCPECGEML